MSEICAAVLMYDAVVQDLASARTKDKFKILNFNKHILDNQLASLKHLKCRKDVDWHTLNCNDEHLIQYLEEANRYINAHKTNNFQTQFTTKSRNIDNDFHLIHDVLNKLSIQQEKMQ